MERTGIACTAARCALGVLLLLAAADCAAQRILAADRLAEAGIAYADAVPAVFDESFELAVAADSIVLVKARAERAEERAQRLTASDGELQARLQLLRRLKEHAFLVRSYFIALRSLNAADAASGISGATQDLANRITALGSEISRARLGDAAIGALVDAGAKLAVGAYQNAALRAELQQRGDTIADELELQRAALAAIGKQMLADQDLQVEFEERSPLFREYVQGNPQPLDWSRRRSAAFRRTVELASLDAATRAAANLRQSWIAFVENRLDAGGIALLLEDVGALAQLAEKIRAAS